jgi:hypothetical protein
MLRHASVAHVSTQSTSTATSNTFLAYYQYSTQSFFVHLHAINSIILLRYPLFLHHHGPNKWLCRHPGPAALGSCSLLRPHLTPLLWPPLRIMQFTRSLQLPLTYPSSFADIPPAPRIIHYFNPVISELPFFCHHYLLSTLCLLRPTVSSIPNSLNRRGERNMHPLFLTPRAPMRSLPYLASRPCSPAS